MANNARLHKMKIASWNVNGLWGKKNEVEDYLKNNSPDIMAIQESRMPIERRIKFRGYETYRKDRPIGHQGGGVVLLVKIGLEQEETTDLGLNIEAITIKVKFSGDWVQITSVYNPPQNIINREDMEELLQGEAPKIIIGDLNSKSPVWNSTTTNRNGRTVLQIIEEDNNAYILAPNEPTIHVAHYRPDIVDIAIIKNVNRETNIVVHNEGTSDHSPIMVTVGDGEDYIDTIEIKTTNWQIFPQKVSQKITEITRINTKNNLEEEIRKLQDKIIQAANESSKIRRTERVRNDDILPYHIRRQIQLRRACKRRYRNFQNEENRIRLNEATSELRRSLKQHAESKWQRKLESLETTDGSLWKITKALRNPKERIPPLHGSRGGRVYTDTEKAEAMADALERECVENNHIDDDEDHENLVFRSNNRFRRERHDEIIPNHTTPGEVKEIIKNIKTKKAPGRDGVSNKMLKKLPRKGIAAISNIINAMMRLRHYPTEWKTAEVIMLPKPNKDRRFPQNYRPISLLPAISKIAERVIQKRIWSATEELNILPEEQFGFRKGHSSEHQVLRTVEHAAEGLATRRSTGLVLLDIERAFDRVWREGLVYKMNLLGYPEWITRMIDSYLKDRKITVKVGDKCSTIRQTEAGTPQGAVLSPLLYNIYTSDIPINRNTQLGLFADDTAIAARSTQPWMVIQKLQQHLDQINEWLIKWKIHPNVEKTKATYITRRRQRPEVELNLDGQNIIWDIYV